MSEENQNTELNSGEKSTNPVEENSVGEITLEQFKDALENNLECKGYYDSIIDKTVSKRLDKGIESWKTSNLENLINEEINIRYPQKSETEIALEKVQEEKHQLELQVQYQQLMTENKLPLELLDFIAGKDMEDTIVRTKKFNNIVGELIEQHRKVWVHEWASEGHYTPPGENGSGTLSTEDIWKMML